MINSTYTPKRFEELNSDACMVNGLGVSGTAVINTTSNIDLLLSDDHIITGLQVSAQNSTFGDSITMQVVDIDSVLPTAYGAYWTAVQPVKYPTYPVCRQFATNWGICSDVQLKFEHTGLYPAKVIAGLYLRLIYTSIATSGPNVGVLVNYELHKVMF